jgi:hypothetical protein
MGRRALGNAAAEVAMSTSRIETEQVFAAARTSSAASLSDAASISRNTRAAFTAFVSSFEVLGHEMTF